MISAGSTRTPFSETSSLYSSANHGSTRVLAYHLVDVVAPIVVVLIVVSLVAVLIASRPTNHTVD